MTRVVVVGAGIMGSGIAQACAAAGHPTVLVEPAAAPRAGALERIGASLVRLEAKGTVAPGVRDAVLARLTVAAALDAARDAEVAIEAVPEDRALKRRLFADLERLVAEEALLASNTSSIPIGDLAAGLARPGRVLGLHFFNPVPLMPLVEVVRAVTTTAAAVEAGLAFVRSLGKTPVACRDGGGFIVNRLLVPYLLDAIRAHEAGVGTIGDIEIAMRLGAGHPMGPFTLLDQIGLDTALHVAAELHAEFAEPRFAPPPLLRRLVAAGHLGRKTGLGFLDWGTDPPRPRDA